MQEVKLEDVRGRISLIPVLTPRAEWLHSSHRRVRARVDLAAPGRGH